MHVFAHGGDPDLSAGDMIVGKKGEHHQDFRALDAAIKALWVGRHWPALDTPQDAKTLAGAVTGLRKQLGWHWGLSGLAIWVKGLWGAYAEGLESQRRSGSQDPAGEEQAASD